MDDKKKYNRALRTTEPTDRRLRIEAAKDGRNKQEFGDYILNLGLSVHESQKISQVS